jgi:hypothetical protein
MDEGRWIPAFLPKLSRNIVETHDIDTNELEITSEFTPGDLGGVAVECMRAIGHTRDSGRAVFVAESPCIEHLPQIISLSCSRFVLLLAYDHTKRPARLVQALGRLLDQGCVYLCTWGIGIRTCSRHDG